MSAEAVGWTYRYSAMTGSAFSVHLAIADTVNDMHGHEVWLAQDTLATKARCDRKTARAALDRLAEAGYLTELEGMQAQTGGRPVRRFRFEMPDVPVVYESRYAGRPSNGASRPIEPSSNGESRPSNGESRPSNGASRPINPKEPNRSQESLLRDSDDTREEDLEKVRGKGSDYRFGDAWELYPTRRGRKVNKEKAREQWKRLTYEEKGRCFRSIKTFAAERPELPPDMFRWLRDRTWVDYLEPAGPDAGAARPAGPARKGWDQMTDEEFAVARRGLSDMELTEALDARRRAEVLRGASR